MFRCSSIKHDSYYLYGGKGISVCDEWKDYNNFKKWALENGYSDNLSIDNNTNRNLMFEIDGTTKSLAEWCREYNASYARVHSRIYSGWNIIDALTRPVQIHHKKAGN